MSSPHIVNVTDATFQQDVLDHSARTPVIIDFWAPWCGPCKTIGPILESLAEDYEGAFRLAKIDVDQNPRIAQAAQIQSIPTLMAAVGGQIIDQVVGGLPRAALEDWIDKIMAHAGVSKPTTVRIPTDPAAAQTFWLAQLEDDPTNAAARLALGRLLVDGGNLEKAKEALSPIEPAKDEYNEAQALLALMGLLVDVAEVGGEAAVQAKLNADPDDPEARYLAACVEGSRGRFVQALDSLLGLVASAPAETRGKAKKAASTILAAAGRGDDEVEGRRRQLARLLF